jgi:GNAT superfamily N-acetyltransferase
MNPAQWEIRPYQQADADHVHAMAGLLSRRSLYQRFFSGMTELPRMFYTALARVDHHDREALLAFEDGAVVGIAEYIRDHNRADHADLAVLVTDGWQQRGVARALVTELAALAVSRGIAFFTADVLADNRAALAAITRAWPQAQCRLEGATASFALPLIAGPRQHGCSGGRVSPLTAPAEYTEGGSGHGIQPAGACVTGQPHTRG